MKSPIPFPDDKPLTDLLRQWKVNTSLPSHFQEAVWRRIERAEAPAASSIWDGVARWVGAALAHPSLAAAYVAVLLLLGGAAGWTQAHQNTARVRQGLGQRYVRVLDPYLGSR